MHRSEGWGAEKGSRAAATTSSGDAIGGRRIADLIRKTSSTTDIKDRATGRYAARDSAGASIKSPKPRSRENEGG